jgi:oligopeptidase B
MHGPAHRHALAKAPACARHPSAATWHGTELVDDYAWLKASNWQDVMRDPSALDPAIRAYLDAENAFCDAQLSDTRRLQDELFVEMKGRLKENDSTVPSPDGPFAYSSSFVAGGQYPLLCRRPRAGGPETVLLDGNAEAAGKPYWDLGYSQHSPNHALLAYSSDDRGSELYTIRIRDLATGEDLADYIPDTRGSFVWGNDNKTLFYVRLDDNHRPLRVYRHTVGTPVETDVLVYEEKNIGYYVALSATQSAKFILIDAHDHQSSEVYLVDADAPAAAPRLIEPRRHGHEYSIEHHGETLFITTNSGGAEDFRICTAPVDSPGMQHWQELVAHRPGCLILDTILYRDHMVRLEREEGLPRIVVRRLANGIEHTIAFPEEAYALGISPGYEFDTTTLRFVYSSMTTPAETYDYDMETRARVLRKRQEVPSGHDADAYVTRRLYAPAPDGELVPISILYHRDTPLDGSAPVFLYGYGAYGISIPSSFATTRLSLVDRGFIYAIAHIRGGKDKGYRWYTSGKLANKVHTFTDFVAAGEYLVAQGLTRRGRIVANGGSAGGMLMGVVANMAPELFLGIIADVPFVDVLNTMLDKDLPLTPPEWPEWGNPIASSEDFTTIRGYSPYENVESKPYPHIFAYGGLTDPRVTYWEPAKWIARLREKNTSDNLILLKINMEAGHGGASGRYEQLKEMAADYAFALKIADKAVQPAQKERAAEAAPAE